MQLGILRMLSSDIYRGISRALDRLLMRKALEGFGRLWKA